MKIYVVTVRDQDGYYVPVVAGTTKELALKGFESWKKEVEGNNYWEPEHYYGDWIDCLTDEEVKQMRGTYEAIEEKIKKARRSANLGRIFSIIAIFSVITWLILIILGR
jgi:thiaminase